MEGRRNKKKKEGQKGRSNFGGLEKKKEGAKRKKSLLLVLNWSGQFYWSSCL